MRPPATVFFEGESINIAKIPITPSLCTNKMSQRHPGCTQPKEKIKRKEKKNDLATAVGSSQQQHTYHHLIQQPKYIKGLQKQCLQEGNSAQVPSLPDPKSWVFILEKGRTLKTIPLARQSPDTTNEDQTLGFHRYSRSTTKTEIRQCCHPHLSLLLPRLI